MLLTIDAGNTNTTREKSVLWSRFHHDYQHNPHLKSQSSADTEGDTEEKEQAQTEETQPEIEDQEDDISDDNEDLVEDEEDIFTKSLAPENLDLKNFLSVEDRKKKISQISEIIAYNISQQKQVRINKIKYRYFPFLVNISIQVSSNSMVELQKENFSYFGKKENNYWSKIFCPCWYM